MKINNCKYSEISESINKFKSYLIVTISVISVLSSCCSNPVQSQTTTLELNSNWHFRKYADQLWLPAKVPGTVHMDLLKNKIIPDPFFGDNEKKLQWIGHSDWVYLCNFDVDNELFGRKNIDIVFEGMDTRAKVWLNDSLIITADNMFRTWKSDVKQLLRRKDNKIIILFESPLKVNQKSKSLPYTLPGGERVFTRKAQYQFGWDWGPVFVTCGIWKPVRLCGWDDIKLEDVQVYQQYIVKERASLDVELEIYSDLDQVIDLMVTYGRRDSVLLSEKIYVSHGKNFIEKQLIIDNPRLWWCNGMGEPYLYHLGFELMKSNKILSSKNLKIGLRKIELFQEKDSAGTTFYFRLNGVPVFMKGANYIPQDNFLTRVDTQMFASLISDAVECHMNMLRVWGGGIYEKDIFYDLCDEKGILVWQDFMFACAMYPGDDDFIGNVRQEAIENVRRLHNHPCIALWCGNNEIDEGWHNWGWQKQYHYSGDDSAKIWHDYLKLFNDVLQSVLRVHDRERPYVLSSPEFGWGHEESLKQGDQHYWGVWWGKEPFEMYQKKVGRFASEYGFQGLPDINTINSFTNKKDRSLGSPVLKSHEKHPVGFETIDTYMIREYKKPKELEKYIYTSQLVQAYGIRNAIEAHRRAAPYCMGTLYWQFNDCWPVISWSSRDYYGRWKALQYFVKDSYRDVLVSFKDNKNKIDIYIVNDKLYHLKGALNVLIEDFNGKIIWQDVVNTNAPALSSGIYYHFDKAISDSFDQGKILLQAFFIVLDEKKQGYENTYYFKTPMMLKLANPSIKYDIIIGDNGLYQVKLRSDKLVKNIYIYFKDSEIKLPVNYFDMLPNIDYVFDIKSEFTVRQLKKKFRYITVYDINQ